MSISSARSAGADAGVGAAGASGISADNPRPRAGRFSAMVLLRCGGLGGCGFARQELARQRDVRFSAARFYVVENRRQSVARCFAETDVAGDHGGINPIGEERANVARHLLSKIRALVVHRHQHTGDVETGVECAADPAERAVLRRRVAEVLQAELPVIPLAWYDHSAAVSRRLSDVSVDPLELSYRIERIRWAR